MPSYSRFYINLALNAFNITLNVELSDNENRDLVNDSRDIKQGDIFAATLGHLNDGRDYIENAINAGAELIIVQCDDLSEHGKIELRNTELSEQNTVAITLVSFFELNKHLSRLASLYYQQPENKLKTIGITGTNGKTTTSQIIAQLVELCGESCAVIGTTGAGKLKALTPIKNTTPGPTELNKILRQFVDDGISHVAMEISSHALEQKRVSSSVLDIAVFTNLSRDHLDYHHTMEEYAKAKETIFTKQADQVAILNGDDSVALQWLSQWSSKSSIIIYGLNSNIKNYDTYVTALNIKHTSQGVTFDIETPNNKVKVKSAIIGSFNISNLLAGCAVLMSQGFSLEQIGHAISKLKPVIGRMEVFSSPNLPTSIVDYAHTPDALENALKACKDHCSGELHVVFGCGGDRDKGKRSLMGAIAEKYSDHIVLTNDNPRNESPETITKEILSGCKFPQKVNVILSRQKAVKNTINNSKVKDMILFAGKGHESCIVIGNQIIDYNEREFVKSIYTKRAVA